MSTLPSTLFGDPSFERLLTCLVEIRHKLDDREDDFMLLSNYFQSKDFRRLVQVPGSVNSSPDRISSVDEDFGAPESESSKPAVDIAQEVVDDVLPRSLSDREAQELQHILKKPHVKGFLQAHDSVAAGDITSNTTQGEVENIAMANEDDVTLEKPENKVTTPITESHQKEGCDRVDGDDDSEDDDDDDDKVCHIRDSDEDLRETGDRADESFNESEVDSDNNLYNLSHDKPSFSDTKNVPVIVSEVQIHVANEACFRVNEKSPRKNLSVTGDKVSTAQTHFSDNGFDNEVQQIQRTDMGALVSSKDTLQETRIAVKDDSVKNGPKDVSNEIDIEYEGDEFGKEGISQTSNVVNNGKDGGPVVTIAVNNAKTVRLFRNAKETLGITVKAVKNTDNNVRIVVARILRGGLADKFGALHVDDEILEINGKRIQRMTPNEVADIMDGITGNVDIKIISMRKDRKLAQETKVSLRAFFDYNPLQDPLIPCKEVGVAFGAGDILHVVNMDDGKWWQARKDGCSHDKAGLIPSKDFQEKRQQLDRISTASNLYAQKDKNGKRAFPFFRKTSNDSNKILCNFLQDVKVDGWPVYEPVAKYLEMPQKRRLLLLIGAPGVGRNELKKMLLTNSPQRFNTTVPHTSRHMRSHETDGKEYFFVSRQTMENFIQKKKLIEFGEYKGCLYGTSKDSITRAMKIGKTCVLKVQPEVMLLLRTSEFKPFCIFIKPPSLKELRASRPTLQGKAKPTSNKPHMRTFKEEELQEMISASRDLEDTYGKLFDLTVVNKDIDEAYNSILRALERLEREEQWVPVEWVQTS